MKKISIVIPCLNEELVIADVIKNCWEGLGHDTTHQVLIIDSSDDRSPEIARELGADVVTTPRRGLGQAYIDAIPHIEGEYMIVGDADGTYDYNELHKFVEKLDEGFEFVMGSRFTGNIEKDAMPNLHRYFGSPLTTWIFNRVLGTKFSDIHCGMRGMTKDAYLKMQMNSKSWEYASEMIIKSNHLKLKTTEVPINFYKAKNGRISHVQLGGWFTPWYAGWITLKMIFTYGANFFLFKPGIVLFVLGMSIVTVLTFGPIGRFQLHTHLLAMVFGIIGLIGMSMGIIAEMLYDYTNEVTEKWMNFFTYTRSVIISGILAVMGILLTTPLVADYVRNGFFLPFGIKPSYYASISGLFLIVAAFFLFTHTLLVHSVANRLAFKEEKK